MSFQNDVLSDLDAELKRTRTMLERIPEDHFDWKPHDKSWSLLELSTHLANVPWWMVSTMEGDRFDLGTKFPPRPPLESRQAVLAAFDANADKARALIAEADEDHLRSGWSLLMNGSTLWTRPRFQVIREFGISHMGHHRGQLSVYLRLLDVPLPPIFGPTADEQAG